MLAGLLAYYLNCLYESLVSVYLFSSLLASKIFSFDLCISCLFSVPDIGERASPQP